MQNLYWFIMISKRSDAELVLECRRMFRTTLQEADFLDWSEVSPAWYEEGNPLHYLYICEITAALA